MNKPMTNCNEHLQGILTKGLAVSHYRHTKAHFGFCLCVFFLLFILILFCFICLFVILSVYFYFNFILVWEEVATEADMKLWGDEWDWDTQWEIHKEPIKRFIKKKRIATTFPMLVFRIHNS